MIHSLQSLLCQADVNDLRWYIERSEVEITGLRSPPLVRQALTANQRAGMREWRSGLRSGRVHVSSPAPISGPADIDEGRLDAVMRERRVRRALLGMRRDDAEQLFLCFTLDLVDTREVFGRYGNVADRTAAARAAHRLSRSPRMLVNWLDRLARRLRQADASQEELIVHTAVKRECDSVARHVAACYHRGRMLAAA